MTDPTHDKPESDHPHEDDLPLEFQVDQEGSPLAGDGKALGDLSLSSSADEFKFSGPADELDFTEPADFTFPTLPAAEFSTEHSGEIAPPDAAAAEGLFGAEESILPESPLPEKAAVTSELSGEGIPEPVAAEEKKSKPKFALPAWVRTVEWFAVGVLGVGSLLAVIITGLWVDSPSLVTLILNIACPVMLLLIPYSLWRSSARWVTPPASAIYTVFLALAAAALISGTWLEGLELSRYGWQFSKARVAAAKPRPVIITAPPKAAEGSEAREAGPAAPAPAKAHAPAAARASAKGTAAPKK